MTWIAIQNYGSFKMHRLNKRGKVECAHSLGGEKRKGGRRRRDRIESHAYQRLSVIRFFDSRSVVSSSLAMEGKAETPWRGIGEGALKFYDQ